MNRKEKLLAFLENQAKLPYLAEEIALMLGAENVNEVEAVLSELLLEGKVVKSKKGRYEAAKNRGIYTGVYRHNAKGFGFVSVDGEEDFFVSDDNRSGAFSGDTVTVMEIKSRKHSREGAIQSVIKRKNETVVAVYKRGVAKACDLSLDMKIRISEPSKEYEGCRVVVKIDNFKRLSGRVIINLGSKREAESEIRGIMYEHGIPESFPKSVLDAAAEFDSDISDEEYAKDGT